MPWSEDPEIEMLARKIMRYLEEHPNAADTVDGIAAWWLGRQSHEHHPETVWKALEILARHGAVTATPGIDGRVVYCHSGRGIGQ